MSITVHALLVVYNLLQAIVAVCYSLSIQYLLVYTLFHTIQAIIYHVSILILERSKAGKRCSLVGSAFIDHYTTVINYCTQRTVGAVRIYNEGTLHLQIFFPLCIHNTHIILQVCSTPTDHTIDFALLSVELSVCNSKFSPNPVLLQC